MTGAPIISLHDVSKVFRTGAHEVHALNSVCAEIHESEVLGIFGPSGSGKTTFLLLAGLIETPTMGTICWQGRPVSNPNTRSIGLSSIRRDGIGFIFQKSNLVPYLNARENVQLPMNIANVDEDVSRERADELMEWLEIKHRASSYPSQMSGGEQQRVSIARALANSPRLLFGDEPTASLDSDRGKQILMVLRDLAKRQRVAVCIVTHDMRSLEFFDRVLVIRDGRITEQIKRNGSSSAAGA